jgi:transcriptional regulator
MPEPNIEVLRGTLDLLILKAVGWGPAHGYAIARGIERAADDVLRIEEGSLYPALHRLETRGWIAAEWGTSENNRRAKFYSLTSKGPAQLRVQTATRTRFAHAVFAVLEAPPEPAS